MERSEHSSHPTPGVGWEKAGRHMPYTCFPLKQGVYHTDDTPSIPLGSGVRLSGLHPALKGNRPVSAFLAENFIYQI